MNKNQVRITLNNKYSLTKSALVRLPLPHWQEISIYVNKNLDSKYFKSWDFMVYESSLVFIWIFEYIKKECGTTKQFIAKAYFAFKDANKYYQLKNLKIKKFYSINNWKTFFEKLFNAGHYWLLMNLLNYLLKNVLINYYNNWWLKLLNDELNTLYMRFRKELHYD